MRLTEKGRTLRNRVLVVLLIAGGLFGLKTAAAKGYGKRFMPAFLVESVQLTAAGESSASNASAELPLPSVDPSASVRSSPEVRYLVWAWNSQMGLMYANGGPVTTEGSLMEQNGVNLRLTRQDMVDQMQTELYNMAKGLHDGQAQPRQGAHFVAIMGDGSAAFLAPLNEKIRKDFGPEYQAEIIGSAGYSRGEDKLMGPKKWRDNPQSMRGSVVAAYLRDGDWAIVQRYAADNQIPNNPDETTYNPNAINWIAADGYIEASKMYNANYCEERPVVNDEGKKTGETKRICVEGVATWTPGDVIIKDGRGGLVSVVSTKPGQYSEQMPNTIIGIRKWNEQNREIVEGMLQAIFDGGDQVKAYPRALRRAAEASNEVYNEDNTGPEYWERYYTLTVEKDRQGNDVELGGSSVNNLADNLKLFGLAEGYSVSDSPFKSTYEVFGKIVQTQYPKLIPNLQSADDVINTTYIQAVASRATAEQKRVETVEYDASKEITSVLGRADYRIEFQSGQATFTPEARKVMDELFQALSINTASVEIIGHTDSDGDSEANQALSEARAFAVKEYLEGRSRAIFPQGRLRVIAKGETEPVASNATAAGKAQNRRVEIVIGS